MSFDVENTRHWRPFFDRSFLREGAHWTSVQVDFLKNLFIKAKI
jgi:hypothetical protein